MPEPPGGTWVFSAILLRSEQGVYCQILSAFRSYEYRLEGTVIDIANEVWVLRNTTRVTKLDTNGNAPSPATAIR